MQTVQFKVLNTDAQETNVQMQTENKAQRKRRPFPQGRSELRMRKVPDGLPVCS